MKVGFYTSTLSDRPAEEVMDFAREAGFDAIEFDVGGGLSQLGLVAVSPAG